MIRHGSAAFIVAIFLIAPSLTAAADSITDRIAKADTVKGEKIYGKCKSCHTIDRNGENKVGPNLWGIVGREVASLDSYDKYSSGLKEYGGTWTFERLDAYLKKPKAEVPKTKKVFSGLKKEVDRSNLLAYLDRMRDNPAFTPATKTEDSPQEESEYGVLVNKPGVEETFIYCTACHSERLVAQQGLTREDWDHLLEWMVEEQEMEKIEEPDRTIVLDYLSTNYNVDRPNFPK